HRRSDPNFARISLFLAGQYSEERCLARAVRTDDADDAALRQLEAELLEQQLLAIRLGHTVRFDDKLAEPGTGRDVDLVGLVTRLELARAQLLESLHPRLALGLAGLRVGAHPLELALEHALERALLLLLDLQSLLLLLQPGCVVALPGNTVAAVELQDPAGNVVEEI